MPKSTIKQISFNNHQDVFAVASDDGIHIINVKPVYEMKHIKTKQIGSVRLVALRDRTNLVAFVSGNPMPKYASNVVMIYDLQKNKPIVDITLDSAIIGIKFTDSCLVVIQERNIQLFDPDSFQWIHTEATEYNKRALVAVAVDQRSKVLFYPGRQVGTVKISDVQKADKLLYKAPSIIRAHENGLTHIVLNTHSTIVATASESGTVVKLFETQTLKLLHTLHRGADTCRLDSLRFSNDAKFLNLSSDKGTIHVFYLGHGAPKMFNGRITSINKFTMPVTGVRTECAFTMNDVKNRGRLDKDVVAIGYDSTYQRYTDSNSNVEDYECLTDVVSRRGFCQF
uniref:WD_REPEATS_REGION domain-containing protein n=1 Tax=Panagrellus redivivus TaxID=6233 RepID=A0A7E4UM91_PANRE